MREKEKERKRSGKNEERRERLTENRLEGLLVPDDVHAAAVVADRRRALLLFRARSTGPIPRRWCYDDDAVSPRRRDVPHSTQHRDATQSRVDLSLLIFLTLSLSVARARSRSHSRYFLDRSHSPAIYGRLNSRATSRLDYR